MTASRLSEMARAACNHDRPGLWERIARTDLAKNLTADMRAAVERLIEIEKKLLGKSEIYHYLMGILSEHDRETTAPRPDDAA